MKISEKTSNRLDILVANCIGFGVLAALAYFPPAFLPELGVRELILPRIEVIKILGIMAISSTISLICLSEYKGRREDKEIDRIREILRRERDI